MAITPKCPTIAPADITPENAMEAMRRINFAVIPALMDTGRRSDLLLAHEVHEADRLLRIALHGR